jgi:hypothetical protein
MVFYIETGEAKCSIVWEPFLIQGTQGPPLYRSGLQ